MRLIIYSLSTLLLFGISFSKKPRQMIVATGGKGATYHKIYKDLGAMCIQSAHWLEHGTDGSHTNYKLVDEGKVNLAFMQGDIFKVLQENREKDKHPIEILLPLYNEEVHLISTTSNLLPFKDRKRIAVWGGTLWTAKFLKDKMNLNYTIVKFQKREAAMKSLKKGKVDLVMAVVGQPAKWIQSLKAKDYTLIPFSHNESLSKIYTKSSLSSYKNISDSKIPTMATKSVIVTKDLSNPNRRKALIKYKKCAINSLPKLKKSPYTHNKWKEITF